MNTNLIEYDFNKVAQDYKGVLIEKIKETFSYCWHHSDSKSIVNSNLTAVQIKDLLSQFIEKIGVNAFLFLYRTYSLDLISLNKYLELKRDTDIDFKSLVLKDNEGETFYCEDTLRKLIKIIGENKNNPTRHRPLKKFSCRETEIIRLICKQLTNKEMADILQLSIRTVESHRKMIQKKAGAKNSIGIALYAIKHRIFEI